MAYAYPVGQFGHYKRRIRMGRRVKVHDKVFCIGVTEVFFYGLVFESYRLQEARSAFSQGPHHIFFSVFVYQPERFRLVSAARNGRR
ncbi:hypothetical protein D9M69_651190 [compost metagenome]